MQRTGPLALVALLGLVLVTNEPSFVAAEPETLATVGVGSCNDTRASQGFWYTIGRTLESLAPGSVDSNRSQGLVADAWIWLGDVVYAAPPLEAIGKKYADLRSAQPYSQFVANSVKRVLGVWDDHDMGDNDGGKHFEHKDAVQQMFLDFLDEPKESPRREQQGLFSLTKIPFQPRTGKSEIADEKKFANAFCVMLLDVRYFRDDITADRTGDMIGEPQWQMVEDALREVAAYPKDHDGQQMCGAMLIGSGVEFLSDALPTEQWGNFPKSRTRLLHLLREYRTNRAVFLSGDVHFAEICMENSTAATCTLGYPAIDLTTSGLTHASGENFLIRHLFDSLLPSARRHSSYLQRNFGSISLLGDAASGKLSLAIRAHRITDGSVALEYTVPLADLTADEDEIKAKCPSGGEERMDFPDAPHPPLKRFLLNVRDRLVPSFRLHNVIYLLLFGSMGVMSILALVAVGVVLNFTRRLCGF